MSRNSLSRPFAACFAVFALATGTAAHAQPPAVGVQSTAPRPAFSPYLNLNRNGGSAALNYYGIVRPEVQARQAIQNLQGTVAANQQSIGELQGGSPVPPATGHPIQFLNLGGYFLNNGPSLGAGAGGGQQPGVSGAAGGVRGPRR